MRWSSHLALLSLLLAGCPAKAPAPAAWPADACPPPKEVAAALPRDASASARRAAARAHLVRCGQERSLDLAKALIAFPTVTGQRGVNPNHPFTRLAEFLRGWADEAGLDFRVFGHNEVWEIAWGRGPAWLTFVLHADVVPAGGDDGSASDTLYPGWTHPPFSARVIDGKLYGRGSEDDKGPLAAALVVLETLAAFGVETPGQAQVLIGTDEESTWDGMVRYVQTHPPPRFAISVDSGFPVVVGENGFVVFGLELEEPTPPLANAAQLVQAQAGEFLTQVPPRAALRLSPAAGEPVTDLLARVQRAAAAEVAAWPAGSTTIDAHVDQEVVQIEVHGRAVHSSTPEEGFNPLWSAAGLLERVGVAPGSGATMLRLVHRFASGDHLGEKLGLGYHHPVMGPLVVAPTLLRADAAAARLRINMRRPDGLSEEEFNQRLDRAVELVQREISPALRETEDRYVGNPVYTDPSSPLVRLLLEIYRQHTGDTTSAPLSVRGGSYARLFPGGVSFGPSLPGRPYLGHTPDEFIEVETLALLTRMLYDVVERVADTER